MLEKYLSAFGSLAVENETTNVTFLRHENLFLLTEIFSVRPRHEKSSFGLRFHR